MQIIIACGLDSRLRAGFWKNDRAAVCAIRTIQYNNLLFHLLLIIIIYYSSDSLSSLITESLSVLSTQSLSSLSSTLSYHTMSIPNNFTFELCHIQESFRFLASLYHNYCTQQIGISTFHVSTTKARAGFRQGCARLLRKVRFTILV
jgi:hypothetical protein